MDILVSTGYCVYCKTAGTLSVNHADLAKYQMGAYIQDAFPTMSLDDREQLITGTHGKCFDEMFKEEE